MLRARHLTLCTTTFGQIQMVRFFDENKYFLFLFSLRPNLIQILYRIQWRSSRGGHPSQASSGQNKNGRF
jgi:hypothetical protein